jgi:hypothetical protein
LADIRVIFGKNSERGGQNVKKACGTGDSATLAIIDIREKQGA